jgi:hypothetical protein
MKVDYMNILTIAVVAAAVVYASNNSLPVIGNKVKSMIG